MTSPAVRRALDLHPPLAKLGQFAEDEEKALWRERALIRASISDRTWPEKIKAFRALYNLKRFNNLQPAMLSQLRSELHRGLHAEEFGEAMGWGDETIQYLIDDARNSTPAVPPLREEEIELLAEQVDGRLDLIYTLLGELDEMGFQPWQVEALFGEVHASNMTKVDTLGQPVYDANGKVLKGDNYVKADIAGLIRAFLRGEVTGECLSADQPEEEKEHG